MFGISFWKVLLLAAVIGVIWFGFRWFERSQQDRNRVAERRGPRRAEGNIAARDLVACRICGAFVEEGSARACGRPSCPYAR